MHNAAHYPSVLCTCSKQLQCIDRTFHVQFILRREALCLYREFLRVSHNVGGAREKEDMRRWVRGEFDKWRHTTDEVEKE